MGQETCPILDQGYQRYQGSRLKCDFRSDQHAW